MGHPFAIAAAETLSGTRTLTVAEVNEANIFSFDPGGAARNVDLPAEADCKGIVLFISNKADAAEVITIRDDAGGTVCTPTQNESAIVWCDGVTWDGGTLTSS
ncbi:MAG TPA: hypothetical protein VFU14_20155 [Acidimicrobiales bacterium]|nr:hypothetical protein [Acidimicrobiales bacterium]